MKALTHHHIMRDASVVAISVILAIYISRSEAVSIFLAEAANLDLVLVFLAGFFFTSIFTVAPAAVTLMEISRFQPIWAVAVVGSFGAVIADYVLFSFVRDSVGDDIKFLLKTKKNKLRAIFNNKILRWSLPVIGAIVIASPLPDELGVAMLGLNKTNKKSFLLISFAANLLGILAIGGLAGLVW